LRSLLAALAAGAGAKNRLSDSGTVGGVTANDLDIIRIAQFNRVTAASHDRHDNVTPTALIA